MKKIIYILLAALCCSCTIMDAGYSGRDSAAIMLYAEKLFNLCIMTPAAISERLLDDEQTEIELTETILDADLSFEETGENQWNFTVRFGKAEFRSDVTYAGTDENGYKSFKVYVEGYDRARLERNGRMTEIESAFEFPQGAVTLTHPRHPAALDTLRDFWKRTRGEGQLELVICRDDVKIDVVTISLGENTVADIFMDAK